MVQPRTKKEQRKRIVDRHRDSVLEQPGDSGNPFPVLAEIGIESGDSVLDQTCPLSRQG